MTAALRLVREDEPEIDISADTVPPPRIEWALIAALVLCLAWFGVFIVGAVAIVSLFL